MAWIPIAKLIPQYMDSNGDPYSGAVLKAYQTGTLTNISMATDNTGTTTVNDVALNASGNPEVSGNVIMPHLDQDYKLALYPDQASADADSGAIWTVDDIYLGVTAVAVTLTDSAGNFTATELESALAEIFLSLSVDNLNINGNTLSSTDTNGDINLTPDGTGQVKVTNSAEIQSGVYIGGTASANLLDDYEEGTFTPTIQDGSFSDGESQTYSMQVGRYTKTGNRVLINGRIVATSMGTLSSAQQARLANLPFTSAGTVAGGVVCINGANLAITANANVTFDIVASVTYAAGRQWNSTAGTNSFLVSNMSDDGDITFEGQYYV